MNFQVATGILVMQGSLASSYASSARAMGIPMLMTGNNLLVDWEMQTITSAESPSPSVRRGEIVTLDGCSGLVYSGELPTVFLGRDEYFMTAMHWADKYKRIEVLATASSAEEAAQARRRGADGIGLYCTERMFSQPDSLCLIQSMILAADQHQRSLFLFQLLPIHQQDFLDVFRVAGTEEIGIRLLDTPLHEFLPSPRSTQFDQQLQLLAQRIGMDPSECRRRVLKLQESDPLLGFRGCRLSIVFPEITEMQTKAIVGR